MSTQTLPRATFDDLMGTEGKAELVNGRIVRMATGAVPNRIAKRILFALDPFVVALGVGEVYTDSMGYAMKPPLTSGRQSFSPDVSYYAPPVPTDHAKFIAGAPTFAVEVRSENDFGPAKDRAYEAKRGDYFEAGTLVVWDVDYIAETVTAYTAAAPLAPAVFRRGDTADAEPAVPGWRVAVDALFV